MAGDPIAWDVAERVAVRVGGREPFAASYHLDSLAPDFEELTTEAEHLVSEATGLVSLAGPARARVVDRSDWVRVNLRSFRRLLRPLTDRLGERVSGNPLGGKITRTVTGAEVGVLLGWMSTRVLGQYDLLVVEDESADEQDLVYYVGPNVLGLEKRFAFPPREFRLWLALHEVTHRLQFTGVPWLRPHFLSLVDASLGSVEPDPKRFVQALRRAADEVRAGRNPLDEGGLVALLATPEQQEVLGRIGGMMSLLEGHGDVTMDRAGADRIPSAARFSRVLRHRRQSVSGPAKAVQKLIGLEAKMNQYEQGEKFVQALEASGGRELVDRVWTGPEMLPTLAEVKDPPVWLTRVEPAPTPDLLGRCTFPPAGATVVAGVSGGADSLALLVLAAAAGLDVTAVHVDHGLRAGSAAEAEVVRAAAAGHGARFESLTLELSPGPNLEARARDARRSALGPGAMTGHTADDVAETVVLNLVRGAGLDGLAAIRPGPTKPLLALRRADTLAVCASAGLVPVQDPSNADPAHRRNRVRHEVLPLLDRVAERDVAGLLARTAALVGDDAALLDDLAAAIDPTDARALAAAPVPLARRAVRRWLVAADPPYPPDAATVERVLAVARGEHRATEVGGRRRVARTAGRLRLEHPPD